MRRSSEFLVGGDHQPLAAVVEHDPEARIAIDRQLHALGHRAVHHDSAEALLGPSGDEFALACLSLGDRDPLEVIGGIRARHPRMPIVVLTAQRSMEFAVEAMRRGASDCIHKPLDPARFALSLTRLLKPPAPAARPRAAEVSRAIIGQSAPIQELLRHIERVAPSDFVVCLRGETGTGKELVTRAIHDLGSRRRGPFIAVNCAAIPHQLQESELFGHERGAFTGAVAARRGRFEQAHGGTLFLDELGEMSPGTQAVLLRVLEERKVQRLGGNTEVPIDIRVICATHRNLEAEVAAGRFREDLYFRLNGYRIDLAPLRARLDDLPLLVEHFLGLAAPAGEAAKTMNAAALGLLRSYTWPGNVRELQNVVRRAVLSSESAEVTPADLPASVVEAVSPSVCTASQRAELEGPQLTFREIERNAILRAMKSAGGSVDKAARVLGLSRATVYRRLVEFATAPAGEKLQEQLPPVSASSSGR